MFAIRCNMTKVMQLVPNGCSIDEIVQLTANILKDGKIIAVPTDTIYGIAGLAQNDATVSTLYKVKGRDFKKPVSICVGNIDEIPKWGKISFPKAILTDLLPGPVTLIMERTEALNPNLNPNTSTIGIRIPKNQFLQHVSSFLSEPLALTSANVSSKASTLAIQEFKELWPYLDLIIDGGILGQFDPHRLGSTVVDLSVKGFYEIQRNGCSLERTVEVLKRYGLKEMGR